MKIVDEIKAYLDSQFSEPFDDISYCGSTMLIGWLNSYEVRFNDGLSFSLLRDHKYSDAEVKQTIAILKSALEKAQKVDLRKMRKTKGFGQCIA